MGQYHSSDIVSVAEMEKRAVPTVIAYKGCAPDAVVCRFESCHLRRVYSYPIKTWCFATEGELTMKATEAVAGWRSGRRARVGCFKFKSILSFPCGRRVSDMRVL